MKNRLIYLILAISILMCLVGCKKVDYIWVFEYELKENDTYEIINAYQSAVFGNLDIPKVHENKTVTSIGENAFYGESIVNVEFCYIHENITQIKANAFKETSFATVVIPISVDCIEENVFLGCSNLVIYAEAESKPEGWSDNWNPDNRPVVWGCKEFSSTEVIDYVINSDEKVIITSINSKYKDSIVIIPDTINDMEIIDIVRLKPGLFIKDTYTETINIEANIVTIQKRVFEEFEVLQEIVFLEDTSITKIEKEVFINCTNLSSVIIRSSVIEIEEDAFLGCDNLTIYAEAESKPSGWHDDWNPDSRPVIWGYTGE